MLRRGEIFVEMGEPKLIELRRSDTKRKREASPNPSQGGGERQRFICSLADSQYRRYSTMQIVLPKAGRLDNLYSLLTTLYLNRTRLLHSLRSFAMTWIVDVARLSGRLGIKNRQYVDSLINNHISSLRGVERRSSLLPQVQQASPGPSQGGE